MRILLVGGGGREHALGWRLTRDDPAVELVSAPGNPGLAALGAVRPVSATDVAGQVALARELAADLVVVGPEAPLEAGLVDALRAAGIPAFGPTAAAARIETSKAFAKRLMLDAGVPTAPARTFTDAGAARAEAHRLGAPVVIKASGIAAGKGVVVAQTLAEADKAIDDMLVGGAFGDAGAEVLVEECMTGEELSLFAITDGTHVLPMLAAQDHKRVGEGDTGPNTGGMGAYCPVALATPALVAAAVEQVFTTTLRAMREAGCPFTGLLYAGLMLTPQGPKVVEFNCRFGDPETQAILPMLEPGQLLPAMRAVATGASLAGIPPFRWRAGASVTTVVAAQGYPGPPRSGDPITLPADTPDRLVFHAGTRRREDGTLVSAGGRVIAVTAIAADITAARAASAAGAAAVRFEGAFFRRDIGWREEARAGAP